tara:strand:- start:46 stop:261 length:216 start_codon:yes stop_codon:yes gene_type:complete
MDKKKFNRIIESIREEMMNTDPSATGKAGFSHEADPPVSGYSKLMSKMKRRKKYAYLKHDKPRTRWKNASK